MTTDTDNGRTIRARTGADHPGPPPAAAIATSTVLLVLSVAVPPVLGDGVMPAPTASAGARQEFFAATGAVVTAGTLQMLSGVLLVAFAAIVQSRLVFLAPHAPGPLLAGGGSMAAGLLLAVSGLSTITAARSAPGAGDGVLHALSWTAFLSGGTLHVALLGVSLVGTAVTTIYLARTPRWLAIAGVVLGVVDILIVLSAAVQAVQVLLPVLRVLTLVWLIAVASLLPRRRAARGRSLS